MPDFKERGFTSQKFLTEAGFAHIVLILILLVGIVGGVYLVQHPTIFRPKASELKSTIPVQLTDLEKKAADLSRIEDASVINRIRPQGGGGGPTPSPAMSYRIHLYDDSRVSLEKIKIVGVYFVPKEEIELTTWEGDLHEVLGQVQDFYTREFLGTSELKLVIAPKIDGRKRFDEYQSQGEIENEVRDRLLTSSGDLYDPRIAEILDNEFQSVMIYIELSVHGEGAPIQSMGGWHGVALQGAFWLQLDARTTHQYGPINSAHEFGHTLDIPHPWSDPDINTTNDPQFGSVEGNVMGYNFDSTNKGLKLKDGYIMPEQKMKLGIRTISCADIDGSGGPVDLADLGRLKDCFGKPATETDSSGNSCTRADLNHDGNVNISDFSILRSQFGTECTQ